MEITAAESAKGLHGLRIGYLVFEGARVGKASPFVDALLASASAEARARFSGPEAISGDQAIRGIRRLFSAIGLDPTKERPSGEALIRRVVGGQGVYRINCAVDVNNAISLRSGLPCGIYDKDRIQGPITLAIGKEGDSYEGIGGRPMNACGRLVTSDSLSIFGAPTADSKRTCVGTEAKSLLMLIYHYDAPGNLLEAAMESAKKAMESATGGECAESGVFEIP